MRLSMGMRLGDLIRAVAGGAAPGSPLLTGLLSYWGLDTDWKDAVGSNDLTPSATPPTHVARGPLGTVASFVKANTERLSVADTPALSGGADKSFTFAFWLNPDNLTGDQGLFSKGTGDSGTNIQYFLEMFSDANLYWYVGDATAASYATKPVTAGRWQYVVCGFDATSGKGFLSVDLASDVLSNALASGAIQDGAGDFSIGRYSTGVHTDSKVARFGVWSRVLPSDERASLFNNGNGKSYADLTTAEKVGLVSYWNLDEVSGNRADSHGSNTLTDNNSVMSSFSGPAGTVATFVSASSEKLTLGAPVIDGSQDWAIALWIKDTPGGGQFRFNIGHAWGTANYMTFQNGGSGGWFLPYIGNAGELYNFGRPTTVGEWHLAVIEYDSATKVATIYVDNDGGSSATALTSHPDFAAGGTGTTTFGYSYDGSIGPSGAWQRKLGTDRTTIFNGGRGKKYADLTTAEKVGLVSYWNMTETSGDRADSHGSNTLTDTNTVGSVINAGSAMNGSAASFVAASAEGLSKSGVTLPESYTVSAWFRRASDPGTFPVVWSSQNTWANKMEGQFYTSGGSTWIFLVGYTTDYKQIYVPGVEVGSWYHIVCTYDAPTKTMTAILNNGTPVTDVLPSARFAGSSTFGIGQGSGGGSYGWHDGQVDEVAIWDRVLNPDEITELFNAGAGKYYPFS